MRTDLNSRILLKIHNPLHSRKLRQLRAHLWRTALIILPEHPCSRHPKSTPMVRHRLHLQWMKMPLSIWIIRRNLPGAILSLRKTQKQPPGAIHGSARRQAKRNRHIRKSCRRMYRKKTLHTRPRLWKKNLCIGLRLWKKSLYILLNLLRKSGLYLLLIPSGQRSLIISKISQVKRNRLRNLYSAFRRYRKRLSTAPVR